MRSDRRLALSARRCGYQHVGELKPVALAPHIVGRVHVHHHNADHHQQQHRSAPTLKIGMMAGWQVLHGFRGNGEAMRHEEAGSAIKAAHTKMSDVMEHETVLWSMRRRVSDAIRRIGHTTQNNENRESPPRGDSPFLLGLIIKTTTVSTNKREFTHGACIQWISLRPSSPSRPWWHGKYTLSGLACGPRPQVAGRVRPRAHCRRAAICSAIVSDSGYVSRSAA